ncbi:hypothetical protein LguiB_021505 [Lonicera macranthoides]
MVAIRSHQTSFSTSYDVFLSFRGEDTRYTFTDHLYKALDQHGFRTFRDDDEMQKGECLKSEFEKAVPQSKSSIIVISENYAYSSWCLDELVMILERRRTSGHVVLPVFYHVEPSEVRKQTGRIADAFAKYEKQCDEKTDSEGKRTWMEKIQGWRSALTEVADLNGHHHVDGYESKFIDKIIEDTKVNVSRTPLHVDPYIIGIHSQVEKINMWLQDGSNNDKEVFDVLEYETGTEAIEGLTLDMHMLKEAGNLGKKRNNEEFRDKSILSMYASSLKRRCNVGELPSEMRNMQSLEVLNADGIFTNLVQISSGGVKWWEWIVWPMVAKPRKGPETLWASLPCSLRELSLARCNLSNESFPANFVNLPSLYYLDLSYNPFRKLPNLIKSLSFYQSYLTIRECHRLRLLDFNGLSAEYIGVQAEGCRSLKIVMPLKGSVDFGPSKGYNELVGLQDSFENEDITEYFGIDARCRNIQGTHKHGVYSIFLYGYRIPTFIGEKCEGSSSICFTVPSLPTRRIKCLNTWCKWWWNSTPVFLLNYETHFLVNIENKTKDLTWIEQYNCPEFDKYVGWLSRWRLGNQLEAGDEIIIIFCYIEQFDVKECGYKIVYYDPEEEEETENRSTSIIEVRSLSIPTPVQQKKYQRKALQMRFAYG